MVNAEYAEYTDVINIEYDEGISLKKNILKLFGWVKYNFEEITERSVKYAQIDIARNTLAIERNVADIVEAEQTITDLDLANIRAEQTITDLDLRVLRLEAK